MTDPHDDHPPPGPALAAWEAMTRPAERGPWAPADALARVLRELPQLDPETALHALTRCAGRWAERRVPSHTLIGFRPARDAAAAACTQLGCGAHGSAGRTAANAVELAKVAERCGNRTLLKMVTVTAYEFFAAEVARAADLVRQVERAAAAMLIGRGE